MKTIKAFALFTPIVVVLVCQAQLAALGGEPSAAMAGPSVHQHFITRSGHKLIDGDQQFRFIGANMPGLVLPYDWTLSLPERLHLPTPWEQEDGFKTLDQMNLRVVRLWNLPIRDPKDKPADGRMTWHYVQGPRQFNEESFKVLDNLLTLANRYGVRVIFDFTAESGDYLGGIGTYAAHRGKKRQEFWTDPQLKEDYKATVRYVLGRVNTITGVPYKDDKAILAWQFGNEMHSATQEWLSEMAAYIKSLDSNHLVAETRHRPGAPLVLDPNIDLYTRHLYGNYPGVVGGWPDAIGKELAKLAGQRALFIGEFGPYVDGKMFTHENVVDKTREFLDFVRGKEGVSGALLWSMYFHHQDGGFYWHQIMTYPAVWSYHWPGFPSAEAQREQGIMAAMREAAFRIQGLPVPPVPVPDAPQLLPIGGVPILTWRGSAGASGYDIERAAQADGPWTTIATNVSDADMAYRPLVSDTTARAGDTWFYRVAARNASGVSRPSNVVGPVQVKSACLIDELQDFTRAKAHSDGLKLSNEYNALYAEYLFRANGDANDWISYEMPGPIESVKVVAFFASEAADLTLQVSADGVKFTNLAAERKERRLPSSPRGAASGQRRTMVEYEATSPTGQRYLRIHWNGPAELDRVELHHPGAPRGEATASATLEVGPGKRFARIEDANAQARPGDVILVYPRENGLPYEQTAVFVRQRDVTFRAAPARDGRLVMISGKGFEYRGSGSTPRAIFQFNPSTDYCTLEGFELTGAHNRSHNGAGVRINQANYVTIRNCAIHHNDMGIMSNGDGSSQTAVNQRIEHCAIHHNGDPSDPGYNHNLYLGGTSVVLRFCEIHSSLTGHNVKSRVHHTRVEYCYVHHSANREFDLVDSTDTARPESHAVLLGNIIVKDPQCKGNKTVIHFGQDGGKPHDGTLHLVFNTIVTPFIAPVVDLSASQAKASLVGNLVSDGGVRQGNQVLAGVRNGATLQAVTGTHNWLSGRFGSAGTGLDAKTNLCRRADFPLFVDPAQHDYRLTSAGLAAAGTPLSPAEINLPLVPGMRAEEAEAPLAWQYRHPASKEERPAEKGLTLGAYARSSAEENRR